MASILSCFNQPQSKPMRGNRGVREWDQTVRHVRRSGTQRHMQHVQQCLSWKLKSKDDEEDREHRRGVHENAWVCHAADLRWHPSV
eukprot:2213664-Amphidinium_carterae.1